MQAFNAKRKSTYILRQNYFIDYINIILLYPYKNQIQVPSSLSENHPPSTHLPYLLH